MPSEAQSKRIHIPDIYQDVLGTDTFIPRFAGDHAPERMMLYRTLREVAHNTSPDITNRTGMFLIQDIQDLPDPVEACWRIRARQERSQSIFYEHDVALLDALVARHKKRRRWWISDAKVRLEAIHEHARRLDMAHADKRLNDWYYHYSYIRWDFMVVEILERYDPRPKESLSFPTLGGALVKEEMQQWAFRELKALEELIFSPTALHKTSEEGRVTT